MNDVFSTVTLTKEEVRFCLDFAKDFTSEDSKKSNLDFGNNGLPRGSTDAIADATIGKIGELAFQKICLNMGYEIGVDFEINEGRHNIDFGQDISFIQKDGVKKSLIAGIDIKTSRKNSQWLLLENHKLWPVIVIFITIDVANNAEKDLTVFDKSVTCNYKGFAFLSDFYDCSGTPWIPFFEGDRLIWPSSLKKLLSDSHKEKLIDSDYIGPPLKCKKQMGLPAICLRSSKQELDRLLTYFFEKISVPFSDDIKDVVKANSHLNLMLSKLKKGHFLKKLPN